MSGQNNPPPPRQQHYVPVSYLRRFAVQGKVLVLDLHEGRSFRTTSENILKIRDFYTIARPAGTDHYGLETDYLGPIEAAAAPVIDEYVRAMVAPRPGGWQKLALFVASLVARSTAIRQSLWEMACHFNDLVVQNVFSSPEYFAGVVERVVKNEPVPKLQPKRHLGPGVSLVGPENDFVRYLMGLNKGQTPAYERAEALYEQYDYPPQIPQNEHLRTMVDMTAKLAPLIWHMRPSLLMTSERYKLITSDRPVHHHGPNQGPWGGSGWANPGTIAFLPLCPWACLRMDHVSRSEVWSQTDYEVALQNTLQFAEAFRYLVVHSEPVAWLRPDRTISTNLEELFSLAKDKKPSQTVVEITGGPVERRVRRFNLGMIRREEKQ